MNRWTVIVSGGMLEEEFARSVLENPEIEFMGRQMVLRYCKVCVKGSKERVSQRVDLWGFLYRHEIF